MTTATATVCTRNVDEDQRCCAEAAYRLTWPSAPDVQDYLCTGCAAELNQTIEAAGIVLTPLALSDDTLLHSFTVRAATAPALVEAIEATAAKLVKRLPGLSIATTVTPDPRPQTWCTTHRGFGAIDRTVCHGRAAYGENEYPGRCRVAPAKAVDVQVHAHGLPMWNGWSVAGVLTRDQQGVIAATTVGLRREGDDLFADRNRALMGQCDHCRLTRERSVTVLLEDTATGQIRPVGRTCLTDYTGSKIRIEALAALTALRERFQAAYGGVLTSEEESAPTRDIVALASRYVAIDGFHSSRETDSTAFSVRRALMPAQGERLAVAVSDLSAADLARADEDIALIVASNELSDYMSNLKAAASVDWSQISGRLNKVGLLVSLPSAAQRIRERAARTAPVATPGQPARVNAHIGRPGQKRPFHGTVMVDRQIEVTDPNPWGDGTKTVRKLEIDTVEGTVTMFGGKVNWPAEAPAPGTLVGVAISVLGTIAKHDEYRSHRSTRVNRVTVQAIG